MKHRCQSVSPEALVALGPLIEVTVCQAVSSKEQFDSAQKQTLKLLVDTGAQRTVVDRSIPESMGMAPIRYELMVGVSHIPQDCPVYLMTMIVGVSDGIKSSVVTFTTEVIGMATPPQPRPFSGLLGRDFFRYMRLDYDGPSGRVDLHASGTGPSSPQHGGRSGSDKRGRKLQKLSRRKNRGN